jgi:hypothetical protein
VNDAEGVVPSGPITSTGSLMAVIELEAGVSVTAAAAVLVGSGELAA